MKSRICIASHAACIDDKEYDGIGNSLKITLDTMQLEYIYLKHSMDGNLVSTAYLHEHGKETANEMLPVRRSPSIVRYVSEVSNTIKFFSKKNQTDIFIGIDPLNALAGILLKRKKRVKKTVFFTADYSSKRFSNLLLNKIYHLVDLYCVKHADEVWSVSSRIVDIRKDMGLAEEKNFFVPNVPPAMADDELKEASHDRFELITTGIIDKQLDFEGAIRALAQLQTEYPRLHLTIIGNGPDQARLESIVHELHVDDRVDFTGRLPLEETLKRQASAGIGLALYTGVWGFNYYGDSTKCREFFSFGLPVISTDTHATVEELLNYEAGIVVDQNIEKYKAAIRTILNDYEAYSARSRRLGEVHKNVHQKEFARLCNDI